MIVVNFFGGPGSGKSTSASALFARLKNEGVKTELAREVAKDFIWEGRDVQLVRNQVLLFAMQYGRLKDLEAHGTKVAISDSPLMLSPWYGRNCPYYFELQQLAKKVNSEFTNINVWVERTKEYQQYGRSQTAEEASAMDEHVYKLGTPYNFFTTSSAYGQESFAKKFMEVL